MTRTVAHLVEEQIRLIFAELADMVAAGEITVEPAIAADSQLSAQGIPLALFAGEAVLITAWRRFVNGQSAARGDASRATWGPVDLGPETAVDVVGQGPKKGD